MTEPVVRTFVDRYVLDVQISSTTGAPVWRAFDSVLKRWVSIVFIQDADPRSPGLAKSAQAAAANSSRNVIGILDVIHNAYITEENTTPHGPVTGIISEWTDSPTLNQTLIDRNEPFPPDIAIAYTHEIARTLVEAHRLGLRHGRLRPHNVVILDETNIQISGFGIDSALLGMDSNLGTAEDIRGLGNLLFTLVTGVWPHNSVDGLPGASTLTGREGVVPGDLRTGVPSGIDEIYLDTQNNVFASVREVIEALSLSFAAPSRDALTRFHELTTHTVHWSGASGSRAVRVRGTIIAAAAVIALGWFGWQLMTMNFNHSSIPPGILTPDSSASLASELPALAQTPAVIVSSKDFDPFGNQSENPNLASLAIDSSTSTAWTTVQYKASSLGGKQGVGLVLDLGQSQGVKSVDVLFTEAGNSYKVFVSDSPTPDVTTAPILGQVSAAPAKSQVFNSAGLAGRYVVIWLTGVTKLSNGSFQGGIANVRVLL